MKYKDLIYKIMVLSIVLCFLIVTLPSQVLATDNEPNILEKVYCTATLDDSFIDNEILIVIMPEYNDVIYTADSFSEINCVMLEELSVNIDANALSRIFKLTLFENSKQNVLDSIAILEQRQDIYSASPNRYVEAEITPDDSAYVDGYQWAINQIDLPAAWNLRTEVYSVYVGVIDSGISLPHEDLDNVSGTLSKNFVNGTSPFIDSIGHGTAVASVIGATGDNGIGITGVCWGVNLVSLKILDDSGHFSESHAIEAIEYADEKGIQILNFSLGTYTDFLSSLKVAIQNYSGLFVCSAGNKGLNTDSRHHYPSKYNSLPNLISVGASNSSDTRWISSTTSDSSNYGKTTVDIFAPGSSIYCCAPGQSYTHMSGTSLAAPHVAGVAALILGKYPSLTASQIKTRILNNAESISSLSDLCVSGGRLNAYYALRG